MPRRTASSALVLFALIVTVNPSPAQQNPLKGLDDYVAKTMRDWEVPGLALAVIKDDAIVMSKGFGVRKLGDPSRVDDQTVFALGSCTKGFTATAIAMLVEDGKLKWDDPAAKYLTDLQFSESFVTRELTVRDLLSHRSGLARHDVLWYSSGASREELVQRLRYAKPVRSFRSHFGYQNLLYVAAGQVVSANAGKGLDEFIRARLFEPLGMKSSSTSVEALRGVDNLAAPHESIAGKVQTVAWRNVDNIAAAGGVNSNAADLARWVRFHLNDGVHNRERLLTSGSIKELQTPQTIIRLESSVAKFHPGANFLAYGLGWILHDYRGKKIVQHTGSIDGMHALIVLVPEEKLGIVVLTNLRMHWAQAALMYRILDGYLGSPDKDWNAEFQKIQKGLDEQKALADQKEEKSRVPGTRPSLRLEGYAGTFKDELYGEIRVAVEGEKLVLRYGPSTVADLEHWHHNTYRATWRDALSPKSLVNFVVGARGFVEEIQVDFKHPGPERIVARRRIDPAEYDSTLEVPEDDLRKYLGTYLQDSPPLEVSVEMIRGKLKAVVPGQLVATMVPVKEGRFRLDGGAAASYLQFELEDGRVTRAVFERGEAVRVPLVPKK